ncbi:sulfite exporter TauE/SafE family protein [Humitalea sp. 24SJ18S-53]|uniref:sulfite exporter TauE/SafE family protein n=1 Tax=Humitalea sp. 24SJ18S-53 TaxID=3422307 RepID=UPI003D67656E
MLRAMPDHLPFLFGVFLLAGFVKGVTGLGLPTVGVGLLSLVMPPAVAASFIVVPSLVTNLWQMVGGGALVPLLRRLWPMQAGIVGGTAAGAMLLGSGGSGAVLALGLALLGYAAIGLSPWALPRVPGGIEAWGGPLAGGATGVVSAATGVFVIPAVPYLQGLGLGREALVQALGLSFTTATVALGVALMLTGSLGGGVAAGSLLALGPALAGLWIGQRVRRAVRPEVFRRCFFAGLLALGAHLVLRGLW